MTNAQRAINNLRREFESIRGLELEPIEFRNGEFSLAVRYLGDWEVPADEEDDGDYDWKVPTASTCKRLDELVDRYNESFGVKMTWFNQGEKCWLMFSVKA